MPEFAYVGTSSIRVDARDKVLGKAVYIDDIKLTGMLYGKVLRSKYPHARILRIDTSKAEKLPGVKGVVTGKDLPFLHGESLIDEPFIARDKVRYTGEAVAAVAAVDIATAENALELIEVEYEELPALFDPVEGVKPGATLVHEHVENYKRASKTINPIPNSNICNHLSIRRGDVEQGFAESDYVFEDTFTTPMQAHCCIEPHGAIALIDDETNITLWANNDSPHRARKEAANAFKVQMNKVRVIIAPYIGGNYGGKGGLKAEAVALALAWKVRNHPIKVMYTREEEFCSTIGRHPSIVQMKTGVKRDGTLVAREVKMYLATGAYAEKGPTVTLFAGVSAAGPYRIPNVSIDSYCVYTNRALAGAFRGYGGPQGSWAYESQMDIIAAKLGLDPLDLRLRHVYVDGDTHASGQVLSSEGLRECLVQIAESMEWGTKSLGNDEGRGIACMERAVKTPFGSAAYVTVNTDGTVDVLSSTTEVGQGSSTIVCQIVAEELCVSIKQVRKASPDTAFTPYDASTTSSRSTFHMGNAVKMAAADAKQQLLHFAAKMLKVDSAEVTIEQGMLFATRAPERKLSIAEVLGYHFGSSGTVLGRGYYIPQIGEEGAYFTLEMIFWLLGAQGAEVRVNRETGEVKVLKVYSAHDAGKVINPSACEEQIRGGATLGTAFALAEEVKFKGGMVLNPNLLNYKVPSILDAPEIEPIAVEYIHPEGPYGAKGVGETTNVPTPPAIANAIYDAVGIRIKDLPITPDKVLEALRRKEAEQARTPTDEQVESEP